MKVKYCASWDTPERVTKRLLEQFKTSNEDISNIEFVYDNAYDIIVYNNYISEPPIPNSTIYIFFHEPTWSGSHQTDFSNYNNITVFGFDKNLYSPSGICIEIPAMTFYGGRGDWVDSSADWNYSKIREYDLFRKTKNISSIITPLNTHTTDKRCIYNERYNLAQFLLDNTAFIDFYGGWNYNTHCNTSPYKLSATKDYKFSIAIENQFTKNWISEKFYDSIITNTIPIYYGCTNIREIYPEDGYFLLEDITDHSNILSLLKHINQNSEQLYREMLPNLLKIKERYFNMYNPLRVINELCSRGKYAK